MNRIDFTINGGFPLKQDDLNFSQDAWSEASEALSLLNSTGQFDAPHYVLGSLRAKNPGDTINDKYFVYNGEIWKLDSVVLPALGGGEFLYVSFNEVIDPAGNKVFQNGLSNDTYFIKKAVIVNAVPTPANSVLLGDFFTLSSANLANSYNAEDTTARPLAGGGNVDVVLGDSPIIHYRITDVNIYTFNDFIQLGIPINSGNPIFPELTITMKFADIVGFFGTLRFSDTAPNFRPNMRDAEHSAGFWTYPGTTDGTTLIFKFVYFREHNGDARYRMTSVSETN